MCRWDQTRSVQPEVFGFIVHPNATLPPQLQQGRAAQGVIKGILKVGELTNTYSGYTV